MIELSLQSEIQDVFKGLFCFVLAPPVLCVRVYVCVQEILYKMALLAMANESLVT